MNHNHTARKLAQARFESRADKHEAREQLRRQMRRENLQILGTLCIVLVAIALMVAESLGWL